MEAGAKSSYELRPLQGEQYINRVESISNSQGSYGPAEFRGLFKSPYMVFVPRFPPWVAYLSGMIKVVYP